MNKVNIKDERFGMLVAVEATDKRDFGNVIWKCKCDCGKIIEKSISEVTRNKHPTQSCGCSKAWFIGNSEHGKKQYSNLENNYVMGTNVAEIRRKDDNPTKANTSGYQGVTYLTTRRVFVAYCRFQGYYAQKTCHSLEEAIRIRQQMRKVRDDFIEWYDSLTEEERQEAIQEYDNNRDFFKNYYKNKMKEII